MNNKHCSWPPYKRAHDLARDRRLRPKDGSTSGHKTGPVYRPDSLSAKDVLRDREAHHQPELTRLPTFKQVDGAIKILSRQRGEERDDAPRIAAPGASVHDPDLTFLHSAEGLNLQVGGDQPVDPLDGRFGDFEAHVEIDIDGHIGDGHLRFELVALLHSRADERSSLVQHLARRFLIALAGGGGRPPGEGRRALFVGAHARERLSGLGVFAFADGAIRGPALDVGEQIVRLPLIRNVLLDDLAGRLFVTLFDGLVYGLVIDVLADFLRRFLGQGQQILKRFGLKVASVFRVKFLIRVAVFGLVELRYLGADRRGARREEFFDVRQIVRYLHEQVARPVGLVLIDQIVGRDLECCGGDDIQRVAISLLYLGGIGLRRDRRVRIISRVGDLVVTRFQDVQYAENEVGRVVIGQHVLRLQAADDLIGQRRGGFRVFSLQGVPEVDDLIIQFPVEIVLGDPQSRLRIALGDLRGQVQLQHLLLLLLAGVAGVVGRLQRPRHLQELQRQFGVPPRQQIQDHLAQIGGVVSAGVARIKVLAVLLRRLLLRLAHTGDGLIHSLADERPRLLFIARPQNVRRAGQDVDSIFRQSQRRRIGDHLVDQSQRLLLKLLRGLLFLFGLLRLRRRRLDSEALPRSLRKWR